MQIVNQDQRTKPIIFLAPPSIHEQVKQAARDIGEPMSVWIRDAIRAKLSDTDKRPDAPLAA